ncbi:MAG: glycoside hydrolase family 127 protein [Clostridia bacterium]|nr:glycoside hydrolase family 127 protein [Clostridia bacterium]
MPYKSLTYDKVTILGGLWGSKENLLRKTTVWAVYDRFKETGRFDAFKCDKNAKIKPHVYWDSDVAKWIEGVAYLTKQKRDPKLEKIVDEIVDEIEKNQLPCGYFNSYFIPMEPENIFANRDCHELYCAGHLLEASIAYFEATGKEKFLELMLKYIDYIEKRFKIDCDAGFTTPGHEEIELALVRLYNLTGEKKHLELAKFFVSERGKHADEDIYIDWAESKYSQSHKEPKSQRTAEGHSVRAVYLYSAMADLALKENDEELKLACECIFDDIINRKMYITGGIGSTHLGEAFTTPFDLPSEGAYAESCAAIGLIFFAQRMLNLTCEKKYADVIERVLYNGFLSSFSLDGKAFFYVNPLEIVPQNHTRHASVKHSDPLPPMTRKEVFECSCCPPNIVRFLGSLGSYIYTYDDKNIYLQQYISSKSTFNIGGEEITLTQKTSYPENGKITLKASGDVTVFVRVPEYLGDVKIGKNGYLPVNLVKNKEKTIEFEIPTILIEAHSKVKDCVGKVALMRGPVVYCLEGCDNEYDIFNIRIDRNTDFTHGFNEELGVPTITLDAFIKQSSNSLYAPISQNRKRVKAKFIPYYAFANRGESPMQVWTLAE